MAEHFVKNVEITSPFWSKIRDRSREVTVPAIIKVQRKTQHWYCLKWKEGHETKPHPFWDSDVYKITEAACYFLMTNQDDALLADVEEAVDMIRAAQHPDGYINSYYTVHGIKNRWTNLRDMHELYCLGHLIETCVAYESLTNSGRLYEPVLKAVRHIDFIFGSEEGKKRGYPGHQEIEIGLLRLYELKQDPLLLKMAQFFLLERGARDANGETYFDREVRARGELPNDYMSFNMRPVYRFPQDYAYHQAAERLVDSSELQGHSVRAMYFLIAATDLVRLTNEHGVKPALDRLWRDMVDTKLYITGGLGAIRQWEGFGPSYFLGDTEEGGACYSETCATFGLIIWCQRLLRLDLNAEYGDVMELGLYNCFLGAVGTDGESFYYENPLQTISGKPKDRSRWFEVACCPPNVAKLLGMMGSLIITQKEDVVAVQLYIESRTRLPSPQGGTISIKTDLPWSGQVHVAWEGDVRIALRIPGWATDWTCSMQGELKNGFLYLPGTSNGEVELNFGLKPQILYANIRTGKDEICITRGPLVYCIEDVDNEAIGSVDSVAVSGKNELREAPATSIANISGVIPVVAKGRKVTSSGRLYDTQPWQYGDEVDLTFVPYFLRANRGGKGGMRVWNHRLT